MAIESFLSDVRFALRALLRTPVLFAAAVLTLAAGIGLSTGVFALAYGVLLRPLPFPDPVRLAVITLSYPRAPGQGTGVAFPEVDEWRRRLRTFERVAGHTRASSDFTLRGVGDPRIVRAAVVTDGFFDVLGAPPAQGSTVEIAGAAPVVALSSRLDAQLGPSNRTLAMGTGSYRVAAVMPGSFAFPSDPTDLWVSAEAVPQIRFFSSSDQRRFILIGRLARGVTIAQAQDDARRVVRELDARLAPGQQRDATVRMLHDVLREPARPTVLPFVAGAVLVLLIACANVSGLLVGRAAGRQREYAVRRALGGSAGQVLRASMAESLVVAASGWLLGVWVARLVITAFHAVAAESIPNVQAVRLDWPMLAGSAALALLVGLASGAAPALRALRSDAGAALKGSPERIGRTGGAFRRALVIVQIALTVVLLVSAGLLMRTVIRIVGEERGFEAHRALAVRLMLTQTVRFQATERAPFIDRLVSEVRTLPDVAAAGVGSDLPPNRAQIAMTIRLVTEQRDQMFALNFAAATPGYLEAIGAQLVRGRLFEERDRLGTATPAVITESAARMMFDDRDPIGREWPARIPGPEGQRVKPIVIGVVRDVKYGGLDAPPPATLFAPWEKLAPGNAHLVIRTTGRPESVAPAVRRIVQQLDPTLPVFVPQTLDEVVTGSMSDRRLRLQLAAAFAALALALAAIALWGAVAQSVLDRRREIAVRLALGATSDHAVRLLLRAGAVMILAGVTSGIAGGVLAARTLRHLLHGVAPWDPISFAAAVAVAVSVSLLASYLPARRAASISPAELLREG